MKKFKKYKTLFLLILTSGIFLLSNDIFARSRNEIITEAVAYSTFSWTVLVNNIIDTGNTTYYPGSIANDKIDDRRGKPTDPVEIQNKRWPYVVNSTYTGEAYAWGYFHSTGTFATYLKEGRIAGAREVDPANEYGTDTRFTGIDCAGLVCRAWGLAKRYGTGRFDEIAIEIPLSKLRKGDAFVKPDYLVPPEESGHVVIFVDWVVKNKTAKVIHSVGKKFSTGEHVRRVIEDVGSLDKLTQLRYTDKYGSERQYTPYTPFPQFSSFTPAESTVVYVTTPTISCEIESGTSVLSTDVQIKINNNIRTPVFETISFVHPYKYKVSYTPSLGELQRGTTVSVCITAKNSISLEDSTTWYFAISQEHIQTTQTDWQSGTLENIDTTTSPGEMILAKREWDYVYDGSTLLQDYFAGPWKRELSFVNGTCTENVVNDRLYLYLDPDLSPTADGWVLLQYYRDNTDDPNIYVSTFTFEFKTRTLLGLTTVTIGCEILDLYNNRVEFWVPGPDIIIPLDESVDHVFRLVKNYKSISLFIDGLKKASYNLTLDYLVDYLEIYPYAESARYGGPGPYEGYWDYISYTRGAFMPDELLSPGVPTYVSLGTYTSQSKDVGYIANWDKIVWTSSSPAGTEIILQTRTGNTLIPDTTNWSLWSWQII